MTIEVLLQNDCGGRGVDAFAAALSRHARTEHDTPGLLRRKPLIPEYNRQFADGLDPAPKTLGPTRLEADGPVQT